MLKRACWLVEEPVGPVLSAVNTALFVSTGIPDDKDGLFWHYPAFKESLPEESISMYQVHGDIVLQVSEKLKRTWCSSTAITNDITFHIFYIH